MRESVCMCMHETERENERDYISPRTFDNGNEMYYYFYKDESFLIEASQLSKIVCVIMLNKIYMKRMHWTRRTGGGNKA